MRNFIAIFMLFYFCFTTNIFASNVELQTIDGKKVLVKENIIRNAYLNLSSKNPSDNYDRKAFNDDGSVTMDSPMFKHNGEDHFIISDNLAGVCRLFGYITYVLHTNIAREDLPQNGYKYVNIGSNGKLVRYYKVDEVKGPQLLNNITCI